MSMGRHTYDHEIYNGTSTKGLKLIRNEDGSAMYRVIEDIPQYREPLLYTQANWIDGHGQHDKRNPDAYYEGQSIDTTQEGRVILGPLLQEQLEDDASSIPAPVIYCWFPAADSGAGQLFCATASNLWRLDANGWDEVDSSVSGITDLKVFNDYLFVAKGSSTSYAYVASDGTTITTSNLTTKTFEKFLVSHNAAGTAEVLWAFKQPNEVYSNTGTGLNGGTQWGSANLIGDTANNITNLFLSNDNFMVGREDGLFHFDSDGGQHQLRPDLRTNRSTDNFKYVTEWQAGIYHSEIDGMGEITSYNAYEPMGPLQGIDDIGKRGDVVGLAADKDWIYVAIYDGTNYWIYKGREVRKGGELRWQWCPFIYLGSNATATLIVVQHSATDRRLWFGHGAKSYYVILSDDPTADSTYRFCPSGYVRMSLDYGTDPNWDKLWQSGVLEVVGATTNITVQVKYLKDDGSETECIAASTNTGIDETNFGSAISSNKIQFQLNLANSANTTATPEVSFFQIKGIEKPTTVRIHEATYAIGSEPGKTTETIRAFLHTGRTTTTLLKFADLRYGESTGGTYHYCVMMPGYPQEVEILHEKGDEPELGMRVRLREVSFS